MGSSRGYPVVLTADRTLTAGYDLLFDGMLAASQTTTSPPAIFGPLLMPAASGEGLRAARAPLGLRRIEAALLADGFTPEEVMVVDEAHLSAAIGPDTRAIGISSGEPLGAGMNSSTMTGITGGCIWPQAMFERLMDTVRRCTEAWEITPRIILGGPGAWQLADNPLSRQELGIHHVVTGYAEPNAPAIFRALLDGQPLPEVIPGEWQPGSPIPPIRGVSTMGVIEISRGCGWGCNFCTIARTPMAHLPPATILADAKTNLSAGLTSLAVLSEDLFRYGSDGSRVNPQAVISLLKSLREVTTSPARKQGDDAEHRSPTSPNDAEAAVTGRMPVPRAITDAMPPPSRSGLVQIDHANLVSVVQYTDSELTAIHRLLGGQDAKRLVWVNVGVETASGALLKANGGGAKMHGCKPEDWAELCREQTLRLCRTGFFPFVSLVVGLPGETEAHVRQTLAWVQSLPEEPLAVFPVFYAPIDGSQKGCGLNRLHWELIRTCYRRNFHWVPKLYWDNQVAAGVPLSKRMLLQLMGRGQIVQWKALLAWHSWRSRP